MFCSSLRHLDSAVPNEMRWVFQTWSWSNRCSRWYSRWCDSAVYLPDNDLRTLKKACILQLGNMYYPVAGRELHLLDRKTKHFSGLDSLNQLLLNNNDLTELNRDIFQALGVLKRLESCKDRTISVASRMVLLMGSAILHIWNCSWIT